jgi:hypothetical protein
VIYVLELLIIVMIVLKTEFKNQVVIVHLLLDTIMLKMKLNVQNVLLGVLLVSVIPYVKPVTLIYKEKTLSQIVHVHSDFMKMLLTIVTNVMLNVNNVVDLLEIVTHVLVIEKKNLLVTVLMVLMMPKPQLVHLVTKFVELVWILLITVLLVLMPEDQSQNVHFYHQPLKVLKLLIFQSDLLLLSIVKLNVKLVLLPVINV